MNIPSQLQPGDVVADRFRIDRLIGKGGMGVVYRAFDGQRGDAPLALKVLHDRDPYCVARFHREAAVLSGLLHPAIVQYVSHGITSDGNPFLAMEWLEGEDLAARLRRGPLSVEETVVLGRRVGTALGFAHQAGIVHRDLKPGNLILVHGDVGQTKVVDFGVALASDATLTLTATSAVVGTPSYLAPEQARGSHQVTPRADVFSLGCVLFECLTGRKAFDGDSVISILSRIMLGENPMEGKRFEGIPEPLLEIVSRMLANEAESRPEDGGAVARLFEAYETRWSQEVARSGPAVSLSVREQKLVTVIACLPGRTCPVGELEPEAVRSLDQAAATFGARWESYADGSVFLTLAGTEIARDQACQAARCALSLRRVFPGGDLIITTGNTELDSSTPTEQTIERFAAILRAAREGRAEESGDIFLDDPTAGLLRGHFEIREQEGLKILEEVAGDTAPAWKLLGRPTPFVGREREIATLRGLLAESTADSVARSALLVAEAGMGKSRLISEFTAETRRAGGTLVLTARGDPMSCWAPFILLREMIRGAANLLPGDPDEDRRRLDRFLGRILAGEHLARAGHFIGALLGLPANSCSRHLPSADLSPHAQGDQLRRAVENWLEAECAVQPVLIVLEDLHWGDVPTVRCLDAVLRNLADCPLFVIGTARPEVHELLPGLWVSRGVQEIRLGPLSRRATARLVAEVLGVSAPVEARTRIIDRAAGSPFYLEELVRAFHEDPALTLPGSVVAMVVSRLERLPAEARRVLRAAAVFGQTFWPGGVGHLLGREWKPEDIEAWLLQLVESEVVLPATESRFPPEAEFEFRHAVMREAAYGMLTAQDRLVGHRLAAEWLDRSGERNSRVLAEHHERGGEAGKAARLYRQAAEQALEGNDLEGTLLCGQRAVALGAEGELRGEIRAIEAEALDWLGRMDETIQAGQEAMRLLPRYGIGWLRSAGLVAEAAGTRGDLDTVEAMAAELQEAIEGSEPNVEMVRACAHAAVKLLLGGRPQGADRLLESLQGRKLPGAPLFRAWLERWLGFKRLMLGDSAGFLALMEQAAGNFARAGHLRNACLQRGNAGWAYGDLGAYDDARRVLLQALESAEKLGLEGVAASVRTDLVPVLACLGLADEALETGGQAAAIAAGQGELRMEATARIHLALVYLQREDLPAAEAEISRALSCAGQILPTLAFALGVRAEIALRRGDAREALDHATEGVGIMRKLGALDAGEAYLRLVYAEALAASGNRPEAEVAIAEAREKLQERARCIADPEWRRSFLERVPENRRTFAWSPAQPSQ